MAETLYDQIPSLELADFTNGSPRKKLEFVQTLGDAFTNISFFSRKNHDLSDNLSEKLYSSIDEFFDLPDGVKQKYEHPELAGKRGYLSKGKEKARNTGDLKEFYHLGQPSENMRLDYPKNIWSEELPRFASVTIEEYNTLLKVGIYMLRVLALYMQLLEKYFKDKVRKGNSIKRLIYYFPNEDSDKIDDDVVCAAAHGDINLITLPMGASADGLEMLRRDGKWIPITALPDKIVVNVGDMLKRLTNKKLKSTIHKVVNSLKALMQTFRYFTLFFLHPISEMDLTCLPHCIDTDPPKQSEDITAGAFLDERLREIGLKA